MLRVCGVRDVQVGGVCGERRSMWRISFRNWKANRSNFGLANRERDVIVRWDFMTVSFVFLLVLLVMLVLW